MTSGLVRRVAFTLGALLIYRLGSYIPLPGLNPPSSLSGIRLPAVQLSIFALGIMPYLSAAIIIQMASLVCSKLGALPKSGEAGRRKVSFYTVGLAILLTAFQAFGVASALQTVPYLVGETGASFLLLATLTMTGGTIFLIWLSEMMTARGIGNGLALLLSANVVIGIPREIADTMELLRQGTLLSNYALLLTVLWIALIGLVVFVELGRRRVPVEFAQRRLSERVLPAQSGYLPFKLNSAGVIPAIIGPWFYLLPLWISGFLLGQRSPLFDGLSVQLSFGHLPHMIVGSISVIIAAFIYTSFVVDPEYAAASLAKRGGTVTGVEPGEPTADYLDRVVSYTTCVGAIYLAAIVLIPELLAVYG